MDQHIENLNQNPQPKKKKKENEDDGIGHERGIFFINETGMA